MRRRRPPPIRSLRLMALRAALAEPTTEPPLLCLPPPLRDHRIFRPDCSLFGENVAAPSLVPYENEQRKNRPHLMQLP
ncbi:hypothetical protein Syun_004618 [Stephania yunnanensis]|uniref:Secreted protein n=1 Tax=Stephania yunnanensis TaxID=152371 RepID=A0AAP0L3L8_9MAGN